MNRLFAALLALTIATSAMAILLNTSTTTPYSPFNSNDNGFSNIVHQFNSNIVASLKQVQTNYNNSVILIPLVEDIQQEDYEIVAELVKRGCTIVLLDENGYSNKLLNFIGIKAAVSPTHVFDEISKIVSRDYPVACSENNSEKLCLVTYKPTHIEILGNNSPILVFTTSSYAYEDLDNNGFYSQGDKMGKYIVAAKFSVYNGSLWLIADLNVFTNNLLNNEYNKMFLESVVKGKNIYLCIKYLRLEVLDKIKYLIYTLSPQRKAYEGVATGFLLFTTLLITLSVVRQVVERS